MRSFENCNPAVVALYFLLCAGILMFSSNPLLLCLSAAGALCYFFIRNGTKRLRFFFICLAFFVLLALVNPIVSQNGKTVLVVINNAPVTLEAIIYGAVSAGGIVTVIYWFAIFTEIMTSDKLLYVLGKLSPKLSLIISMGLRYVPLFADKAKKISAGQRGMGLYKEGNIIDRIRCDVRVFSILITWALENGVTTADSMAARGYGQGRRTHFSIFAMRGFDVCVLILTLICSCLTLTGMALGALDVVYYPTIILPPSSAMATISYIAYGILVMIPTFTEMEEKLRWQYLKSKI